MHSGERRRDKARHGDIAKAAYGNILWHSNPLLLQGEHDPESHLVVGSEDGCWTLCEFHLRDSLCCPLAAGLVEIAEQDEMRIDRDALFDQRGHVSLHAYIGGGETGRTCYQSDAPVSYFKQHGRYRVPSAKIVDLNGGDMQCMLRECNGSSASPLQVHDDLF